MKHNQLKATRPANGIRSAKRTLKRLLGLQKEERPHGKQPAEYYDELYANSEEYGKPFWQSRYYFLWTVIIDRLRRGKPNTLLDLGCGSGQFAELVHRDLTIDYLGVDISQTAIEKATARNLPGFRFEVGDALTSPLLESGFDAVVCMEVLEHLERDIELLERIRPGVRCLCTVPNFPFVSHVRHFENEAEVRDRYTDLFDSIDVWGLASSHSDTAIYFLMDGVRRP